MNIRTIAQRAAIGAPTVAITYLAASHSGWVNAQGNIPSATYLILFLGILTLLLLIGQHAEGERQAQEIHDLRTREHERFEADKDRAMKRLADLDQVINNVTK